MARRPPKRAARAASVALPRARGGVLVRALPGGRTLLIGLAVLALAGAAFAGARSSSIFAVRAIEVRGASPAVLGRDVFPGSENVPPTRALIV